MDGRPDRGLARCRIDRGTARLAAALLVLMRVLVCVVATAGGVRAQAAESVVYYRLTADDITQLMADGRVPAVSGQVPAAAVSQAPTADGQAAAARAQVLAELGKLVDKPFADTAQFDAAVAAILRSAGLPVAEYLPIVKGQALPGPRPRLTEVSLRLLEKDPRFRVQPATPTAAATPTAPATPIAPTPDALKGLQDILQDIKDIEYPTEPLFVAAVQARIVAAFMDERQALKPQADIEKINPRYADAVKSLTGQTGRRLRDSLARALAPLNVNLLPVIAAAARKTHPYLQENRQDNAFRWSGGGCNCVLDNRLPGGRLDATGRPVPGLVYGFFPFWHAGQEKIVDFSVLSRAAYYAMPFDDDGNLYDPLGAGDDRLDFAATARAHGTRVDWVIRRDFSRWTAGNELRLANLFKNLALRIDAMLHEERAGWFRRLLDRTSFGHLPLRRGDGVTLYFENYPTDPQSVAVFEGFYQALSDSLRKSIGADDYAVNVMFPQTQLGKGIFQCDALAERLRAKDAEHPGGKGSLLVLIAEPVIDTAERLRQELESCVSEARRAELLPLLMRAIVPVVQRGGGDPRELKDAAVYFDHSFGGIGFWPFPTALAEGADKGGEKTLGKIGGTTGDQGSKGSEKADASALFHNAVLVREARPGAVPAFIDKVCAVVCPNRRALIAILEVLALLVAISLIVRWANCQLIHQLETFDEKKIPYFHLYIACFIAPTLLLFLALAYCDPTWAWIRDTPTLFVLVAVVLVAYLIRGYAQKRREADQP